MAEYRKVASEPMSSDQILLRLQSVGDPAITEYVSKLKSRYGKYALPIEEARRIIDKSMGDKTLTEVLHQMRKKEF